MEVSLGSWFTKRKKSSTEAPSPLSGAHGLLIRLIYIYIYIYNFFLQNVVRLYIHKSLDYEEQLGLDQS